jgi:hypothetical protein
MPVLGVEQILQLAKLLLVVLDFIGRGLGAFMTAAERRVEFLEPDFASRLDFEFLEVTHFDSPLSESNS